MNTSNPQAIKEALSVLVDDERSDNESASTEDEIIALACDDQEVRFAWQSMHLVRDVMQADYHSALAPDFSTKVSSLIAQEQSHEGDYPAASVVSMEQARGRRMSRTESARRPRAGVAVQSVQPSFALWKPVAGLGLAASLAGAAFLSSQLLQTEQSASGQLAQVDSQVESPAVTTTVAGATTQSTQESAIEDLTLQASVRTGTNGTRWRMDNEVPRNEEIEKRLNTLLTNHLEDANMGRVHGLVSHSRVVGYDSVPSEQ